MRCEATPLMTRWCMLRVCDVCDRNRCRICMRARFIPSHAVGRYATHQILARQEACAITGPVCPSHAMSWLLAMCRCAPGAWCPAMRLRVLCALCHACVARSLLGRSIVRVIDLDDAVCHMLCDTTRVENQTTAGEGDTHTQQRARNTQGGMAHVMPCQTASRHHATTCHVKSCHVMWCVLRSV